MAQVQGLRCVDDLLCNFAVPLRRGPGLGTALAGTPLLPRAGQEGSGLGIGPVPRKRRTHGPGKEESGSAPPSSVMPPSLAAAEAPEQAAGVEPARMPQVRFEAQAVTASRTACQPEADGVQFCLVTLIWRKHCRGSSAPNQTSGNTMKLGFVEGLNKINLIFVKMVVLD